MGSSVPQSMPTLARVGIGEQVSRSGTMPYHDSPVPTRGESCLCEQSRFNAREANSTSRDRQVYHAEGGAVVDSSDEELPGQREDPCDPCL